MIRSTPSSFGRPNIQDSATMNRSLENFIENVKTLEMSPVKIQVKTPAVVSRLLDKKGTYYKRRKTMPTKAKETPKKTHEIRVVRKQFTKLDEIPGSAHYKPNFDAVLTQEPSITIPKAKDIPDTSNLEEKSMSEMLYNWSNHLRSVDFKRPQGKKVNLSPLPPSSVLDAKSHTISRSSSADRTSFMNFNKTPGPNAYNVRFIDKVSGVIPFQDQAPREIPREIFENPIRDTRAAKDATIKRQPRQLPFDKQSSREKKQKEEDPIWQKIEEEQREILANMSKKTPEKKKKKKKTADFAKQTRDNRSPFAPFMRKETEPKEPYDVDRGYKYLERPLTSFDIKQRGFKYDRQLYVKTDAPDVIYGNTNDCWKKTQPDVGVPIMESSHDRRDAYYYMPKPCGEEDSRPLEEIEEGEHYVSSRSAIKSFKRPKKKPKALKRLIDTPPPLQKNWSAIEHRYADKFKPTD